MDNSSDLLCSEYTTFGCFLSVHRNVGSWSLSYKLYARNRVECLLFLAIYEFGKQVHAYIIKYHIDFDTSIGNLSFFVEMLSDGVETNEYTLTSVLSACCVMLTLGLGAQIHSLSVEPSSKVFGRGGEEMDFLQQ